MRLFIAIDSPAEVKKEITASIKELVANFPQVAWTKEENLHLTMKFLGYVKEELQINKKIEEGIKKGAEGLKSFNLVFTEVGYFEREQLIIWLGIKLCNDLFLLTERIEAEMAKLGFPKEKRKFTPHITLGRGKRLTKQTIEEIKGSINTREFILPKLFSVSEIILVNSQLTRTGSIYTPVSKFPLL